jgi:hypothetical protein
MLGGAERRSHRQLSWGDLGGRSVSHNENLVAFFQAGQRATSVFGRRLILPLTLPRSCDCPWDPMTSIAVAENEKQKARAAIRVIRFMAPSMI